MNEIENVLEQKDQIKEKKPKIKKEKKPKIKKEKVSKNKKVLAFRKYYLSQILNPETKKLEYLFAEMIEGKTESPKLFLSFIKAISFFVKVAAKAKVAGNLYFIDPTDEQNKYQGFVNLLQAKAIVKSIKAFKMKDNKVVDFIKFLKEKNLMSLLDNELIDSDKVLTIYSQIFSMNNFAENVKLMFSRNITDVNDINISDLKGQLEDYEVNIEKISKQDKKLYVFYFISKNGLKSFTYIKEISGFEKEITFSDKPKLYYANDEDIYFTNSISDPKLSLTQNILL